jgi:HK97 family phage prohead protease
MKKILHKQMGFRVKEAQPGDEEKYIIRGVFSTGDVDRQGEVVVQDGWKLDEFLKNPVILWAHDHWQPAIGKIVELSKTAIGLEGAIQFAAQEYEFAKTIYNLYKSGFMRAFSVGFQNDKYEIDQEKDIIYLKENTLYEISAVNIPANAAALAYSKGIEMSPLEQLKAGKFKRQKSPTCRTDGESKEDCVARKIPELINEGMEQDQAVATANNICDTACEDKSADEAIEKISKANKETIQSAISALTEALKATGTDNKVGKKVETPEKGGKETISVKIFNRAVRQLLKAKKQLKTN